MAQQKQRYFTYIHEASAAKTPDTQIHFTPGKGYWIGAKIGAVSPQPNYGGVRPNDRSGPLGIDPVTGVPKAHPKTITVPAPVAKPAAVAPNPLAALTPSQLLAQANKQAQDAIDPQKAEIDRQRAIAAARAKADELAIQGFTGAAAELLKGIGPQIGAAYNGAAAEVGDLAKGFTGDIGARMAAAEGANHDFAASQGGEYTPTVNPGDQANVGYDLNGYIPGASLAEQGAAAQRWASVLPAIQTAQGRSDFLTRMAQGNTDDSAYADQLITLAKTYPSLRDQALQALQQLEVTKAGQRESNRVDSANIRNAAADNARQERALRDNEKAAGITAQTNAAKLDAEYTYKYDALRLRSQEDKTKLEQAKAQGHRIDAAASKVVGHVVYKDGSEDKSIKVAASGSKGLTPSQVETRRRAAYDKAVSLRGKPLTAPANMGAPGRYVAAKDQKYNVPGGVFPPDPDGFFPATTNDPRRAARDGGMTFAKAQAYLMGAFSMSQAEARAALIATGWKPDGQRP